jgi:calcineurin-like phosphoesterase family protein
MINWIKIDLTKNEGQKLFFTSDTHYNHSHFADDRLGERITPIWKSRGYSSCLEMNEASINNINQVVGPDDILIHLGDLGLRCSDVEAVGFLRRVHCQNIWMIWGNHESPTSLIYKNALQSLGLPEGSSVYPLPFANVIFHGFNLFLDVKYGPAKYNKQKIVCQHFPLKIWDKMNQNSWHVHGHCHGGLKGSNPNDLNQGKIIDAGVDNFPIPVDFYALKHVMDKKEYVRVDNHH